MSNKIITQCEESRILMHANIVRRTGRTSFSTEEKAFHVPLPKLCITQDTVFSSQLYLMGSPDGEHWTPMFLPHIINGDMGGCVRFNTSNLPTWPAEGDLKHIDTDNLLLSINSFTINYIDPPILKWWNPLITFEDEPGIYTPGIYTPPADYLEHFMSTWEDLTHEQINEHLLDKYTDPNKNPFTLTFHT